MISRSLSSLLTALAVLAGSPGIAQEILRTYDGDAAQDSFGGAVANLGDLDLDGIPDHAVSMRYSDLNGLDAGGMRVFSGADGQVIATLLGQMPGDWFGNAFDGLGDLNFDGVPDIVVAVPMDDTNGVDAGAAQVLSGADFSVIYEWFGDAAGDHFSQNVSRAGDVNGDGVEDILVGAPDGAVAGFGSPGYARVFSGMDGSELTTVFSTSDNARFGWWVCHLDDIDLDGYDDFAVGAPGSIMVGNESWEGHAAVYSGRTFQPLFQFHERRFHEFGFTVNSAGDLDHDGIQDLIVGSPSGDAGGSAWIYSGNTGSPLMVLQDPGGNINRFGSRACEGGGDFNGDGIPDLAIGGYKNDLNGLESGSLSVFSGSTGERLTTFLGDEKKDWFAFSGCFVGDIDGDGCDEVLVGSNQWQKIGSEGYARVWRGDPSPLRLGIPVPGIAETVNLITLENAQPFETISFFVGGKIGNTRLLSWTGGLIVVNIGSPIQPPPMIADANGRVTLRGYVPSGIIGRKLRFQAVEWASGRASGPMIWMFR